MLPTIMQQLGGDNMFNFKQFAKSLGEDKLMNLAGAAGAEDDDDVPQLVENFDEASKDETTTTKKDEQKQEDTQPKLADP
jgi:nascent polypeptide-associated complex subunit beta